MKVALVHALPPGGAARRIEGTVGGWPATAGLEVREFTIGDSLGFLPNVERISWQATAPHRHRLLRPVWRYVDRMTNGKAWRALWRAVNSWGPDVVFANPCSYPGGAPPQLQLAQSPCVYYCDEPRRVDYEPAAKQSTSRGTRWLYLPMRVVERSGDRASVAAAAALLTNSEYTAERIMAAYGRRAAVVRPKISPVFQPQGSSPRAHVLSVGTLIPSKGHDLVLRAVAKSEWPVPIVIVAPRPADDYQRELKELASELGVSVQIYVGVTDTELADLYRRAHVTMYLARLEPLGLASLESQACGTPVIVSAEGGLPETVASADLGQVVSRDVDAIASALQSIRDRVPAGLTSMDPLEHLQRPTDSDDVLGWLRETASQ